MDVKPFKCQFCQEAFSLESQLKEHRRVHTKFNPFVKLCRLELSATQLTNSGKHHQKRHNNQKPHVSTGIQNDDIPLCDEKKKNESIAERLVDAKSSENKLEESKILNQAPNNLTTASHFIRESESAIFFCHNCGKLFDCKRYLDKHLESHRRSHECKICHSRFTGIHFLRHHMTLHSESGKPFVCGLCGKKLGSKGILLQHLQRHKFQRRKKKVLKDNTSPGTPHLPITEHQTNCIDKTSVNNHPILAVDLQTNMVTKTADNSHPDLAVENQTNFVEKTLAVDKASGENYQIIQCKVEEEETIAYQYAGVATPYNNINELVPSEISSCDRQSKIGEMPSAAPDKMDSLNCKDQRSEALNSSFLEDMGQEEGSSYKFLDDPCLQQQLISPDFVANIIDSSLTEIPCHPQSGDATNIHDQSLSPCQTASTATRKLDSLAHPDHGPLSSIHGYDRHGSIIKLFLCNECPKTFVTVEDLEQHSVTHTDSLSNATKHSPVSDSNIGKATHLLSCKVCFKPFDTSDDLDQHMKSHDELGSNSSYRHSQELMCDKPLRNGDQINQKQQSMQRTFDVDDFAGKSDRLNGMTVQVDDIVYTTSELSPACSSDDETDAGWDSSLPPEEAAAAKCDNENFTHSSSSKDGSTSSVSKRYPKRFGSYVCSVCDKVSLRYDVHINHLRIHTGEMPYSCKICGKKFRWDTSLKAHTYSHEKGKLKREADGLGPAEQYNGVPQSYKCKSCGKSFPTSRGLKLHMRVHAVTQPYSCIFCPRIFKWSSSLKAHYKSHEKGRIREEKGVEQQQSVGSTRATTKGLRSNQSVLFPCTTEEQHTSSRSSTAARVAESNLAHIGSSSLSAEEQCRNTDGLSPAMIEEQECEPGGLSSPTIPPIIEEQQSHPFSTSSLTMDEEQSAASSSTPARRDDSQSAQACSSSLPAEERCINTIDSTSQLLEECLCDPSGPSSPMIEGQHSSTTCPMSSEDLQPAQPFQSGLSALSVKKQHINPSDSSPEPVEERLCVPSSSMFEEQHSSATYLTSANVQESQLAHLRTSSMAEDRHTTTKSSTHVPMGEKLSDPGNLSSSLSVEEQYSSTSCSTPAERDESAHRQSSILSAEEQHDNTKSSASAVIEDQEFDQSRLSTLTMEAQPITTNEPTQEAMAEEELAFEASPEKYSAAIDSTGMEETQSNNLESTPLQTAEQHSTARCSTLAISVDQHSDCGRTLSKMTEAQHITPSGSTPEAMDDQPVDSGTAPSTNGSASTLAEVVDSHSPSTSTPDGMFDDHASIFVNQRLTLDDCSNGTSGVQLRSNGMPYSCNLCPRKFKRQAAQTAHLLSHTKWGKATPRHTRQKKPRKQQSPHSTPAKTEGHQPTPSVPSSPTMAEQGNIMSSSSPAKRENQQPYVKVSSPVVAEAQSTTPPCSTPAAMEKPLSPFESASFTSEEQHTDSSKSFSPALDETCTAASEQTSATMEGQQFDATSRSSPVMDENCVALNDSANSTKEKCFSASGISKEQESSLMVNLKPTALLPCTKGIKVYLGPVTCDICQKVSPNMQLHRRHLLCHNNEMPYACKLCPRTFKWHSSLSAHLNSHKKGRISEQKELGQHQAVASTVVDESDLPVSGPKRTSSKSVTCDVCHKVSSSIQLHRRHLLLHSNDMPYSCQVCPKKFKWQSSLKAHMNSHKNRKRQACRNSVQQGPGQEQSVLSSSSLAEWPQSLPSHSPSATVEEHHSSRSSSTSSIMEVPQYFPRLSYSPIMEEHLATTSLSTQTTLEEHSSYLPIEQQSTSACVSTPAMKEDSPLPSNFLTSQTSLVPKDKGSRVSPETVTCTICQKVSQNIQLHQRHLLLHTNGRPYSCNRCPSKFKQQASLTAHLDSHMEGRRSVDRFLNSKEQQSVTLEKEQPPKPSMSSSPSTAIKNQDGGGLKRHKRKQKLSSGDKQTRRGGPKPQTCNICGKVSLYTGHHRRHLLLHSNDLTYSCNLCPRKFRWESSLAAHLESHKKGRIARTKLLDKTAVKRKKVTRHKLGKRRNAISLSKKAPRSFPCKMCSEVSPSYQHRRIHLSTRHANKSCSLCPRVFKWRSCLEAHFRSHMVGKVKRRNYWKPEETSGEQTGTDMDQAEENQLPSSEASQDDSLSLATGSAPDQADPAVSGRLCVICGKMLSFKTLTNHMRIHNNEFPYRCEICNRKFRWMECLKSHMNSHKRKGDLTDINSTEK